MYRKAQDRKGELECEWGWHSESVGLRQRARALQDVVVLLQEKNLLDEIHGTKNFIKVGEIERELDWPLQLREKYGPIGSTDYFSKCSRRLLRSTTLLISVNGRAIQYSRQALLLVR